VHDVAVLAQVAVFKADPREAGHDVPGFFGGLGAVVGMHEIHHCPADHLGLGVAEDALAGEIDVDDVAARVDEKEGVEKQVDAIEQSVFELLLHAALGAGRVGEGLGASAA
jgi:hypothetical protein